MKSINLFIAQAGFLLLTLVFFSILIREVFRGIGKTAWSAERKSASKRNIIIALAIWAVFLSAWSGSGMMANFSLFPLNLLPILVIPLITALILTFSNPVAEILQNIGRDRIIRLQSFRFFVEILLWLLFIDNLLPEQMTFEGRNFDILAGLTAPLIAWLAHSGRISRSGLVLWNILCLALLVNIVAIAILSTPTPVRVFMNEPANTVVAYFPVSWLPGFLVPLAYVLHFFSLKQLLGQEEKLVAQTDH